MEKTIVNPYYKTCNKYPMVKRKKLYILLFISAFLYSCDSVSNREDLLQSGSIEEISVSPRIIAFTPADGDIDTTVRFQVRAILSESNLDPELIISNSRTGNEIFNAPMNNIVDNEFSSEISLNTRTTSFAEYNVLVILKNKVYAQSIFELKGFANSRPQILDINNPESVTIPEGSNTVTVPFTAKVTDDEGQESISNVYLNFRNEDGTLLSNEPFILLDDGNSGGESGDVTASDSTYTITFSIDSSNTPNNRTVLYWAIDQSGLSSDTLTAPFNIIE